MTLWKAQKEAFWNKERWTVEHLSGAILTQSIRRTGRARPVYFRSLAAAERKADELNKRESIAHTVDI